MIIFELIISISILWSIISLLLYILYSENKIIKVICWFPVGFVEFVDNYFDNKKEKS